MILAERDGGRDVRAGGPSAAEGGGQAPTVGLCLWAEQQGRHGAGVGTELTAPYCHLVTRCAKGGMDKAGAFRRKASLPNQGRYLSLPD